MKYESIEVKGDYRELVKELNNNPKYKDYELVEKLNDKMKYPQGRTDITLRLANYIRKNHNGMENTFDLNNTQRDLLEQLISEKKNGVYGYDRFSFMRMRLIDYIFYKFGRVHRKLSKISWYDVKGFIIDSYFLIAMVGFPVLLIIIGLFLL